MAEQAAVTAANESADAKIRFCKKTWDQEKGVVIFAFGNGTIIEADVKRLNDEMKLDLLYHGLSQKGGDSYAGAKGDYAKGIASLKEVLNLLYAGEWSGEREGGPRLGELAEAIAKIKNVPLERAMAAVEKATDEQRSEWRSNAKVKSVIATIKAEKAAAALAEAGETELKVDIA